MNEVKKPKKPLIFYYSIALAILLLFNLIAVPWFAERQIKEVDYGTFMTMMPFFPARSSRRLLPYSAFFSHGYCLSLFSLSSVRS